MASPLTIQPDAAAGKDTYIYSSGPTANYGAGTDIQLGDLSGSASVAARSILAFDLSDIPAGAVITSATMSLWESGAGKSAGAPASWAAELRRVLRNWVEGQATYNIFSTGNNWGTAGCGNATDRVAAACATLTLDGTAAAGFVGWSGADLVAVCQGWLDGTFPNYGLLVSAPTAELLGTTDYAYNAFYSSDYTTDAAKRPKLVLEYTPPETARWFRRRRYGRDYFYRMKG